MRYRIFGEKTGLRVSELVLGTAMFGTAWGYGSEPDEARSIMSRYMEEGGNFLDTAESYQFGQSEKILGECLETDRDAVVIASKYSIGSSESLALAMVGNSRKAMVQAVEGSLKRLKTDRIDIYCVHLSDGVTPMEEIARGFDDLVRSGKILYGALSNFPAWRVATGAVTADLRGWAPIAGIQVEYSLLQRTAEIELLPMAEALGMGVMGWSPMAGGLLTGKYRTGGASRATRMKYGLVHEGEERNDAILDVLVAVAKEIGVTPGQVALAWVNSRGIFPVIGSRTVEQMEENLSAVNVKLSEIQNRRLEAATAFHTIHPHDGLASAGNRASISGGLWDHIDQPKRTVA
jgi:aryl-alcohol dehydrogenase-like predicted oxidoreductase